MHDSGKIKMIDESTQPEGGNEPSPAKPTPDGWIPIPKSAMRVMEYDRNKRREWYRHYRKALNRLVKKGEFKFFESQQETAANEAFSRMAV